MNDTTANRSMVIKTIAGVFKMMTDVIFVMHLKVRKLAGELKIDKNESAAKRRLVSKGDNMTKNLKDSILAIIATVIVLVALWFGFDAFFGLVGAIYTFLDLYIWAFFAGIIAFFFALAIIILMIKISLIMLMLLLMLALGIASIFDK